MPLPIGNTASVSPVASPERQAVAAAQGPAAAVSQAIQDVVSISQQGQAASAKLDADGDGDGH